MRAGDSSQSDAERRIRSADRFGPCRCLNRGLQHAPHGMP
ncbi:unnamed protein product, partial [Brassica rapa subsp. trilocularis]